MSAILAIDTATNACSAALWADGSLLASLWEPMVRGHAERLVPMIGEIAEAADRPVKDIDLVAVTVGPGTFTGMRVGLAAARGFALSAGVPCLGLTTLEVIAEGVGDAPGPVMVVIESKRSDVYVQNFNADGDALDSPASRAPETLAEAARVHGAGGVLTLAGDAAPRVGEVLTADGHQVRQSETAHPDAAVLAAMAARRWRSGQTVARPVPLYLRPPDAVVPKDGGRLRP